VTTQCKAFDIKDARQDWLSMFANMWGTKLDKMEKPTAAQKALDDAIAECEAKLLKYQKDIDDLRYAASHHQQTLGPSGFAPNRARNFR